MEFLIGFGSFCFGFSYYFMSFFFFPFLFRFVVSVHSIARHRLDSSVGLKWQFAPYDRTRKGNKTIEGEGKSEMD